MEESYRRKRKSRHQRLPEKNGTTDQDSASSSTSKDRPPEFDLPEKKSTTPPPVQVTPKPSPKPSRIPIPKTSSPNDKLSTTFPRNAPRYRLTKTITLLHNSEIVRLAAGQIVKLISVSFRERGKCKILALHGETILTVDVWRDYLGEKPVWAPEPTKMAFWREAGGVFKFVGAWAGAKLGAENGSDGCVVGGGGDVLK